MSPWQTHRESPRRAEIPVVAAAAAAAAPWPQRGEGAAGGLGAARGGWAGMAAPRGAPGPPAPRGALRERGRMSGERTVSVPTPSLLFTPARRPWRMPRRARRHAGACRKSTASSWRCRGWGGSAARTRAVGFRLRRVPGEQHHHRGAMESPRCTKQPEKQPRSSCLPSGSQVAERRTGVWGSEPPIAQPGWRGGTRAAGQLGGTRPSWEPPAKVTETGTQECLHGAEETLGIFFSLPCERTI